MTIGAADPLFLDTNVLVFSTDRRAPLYAQAVAEVRRLERRGAELWISRQVIREYAATMTRPQSWGPAQPSALVASNMTKLELQFRVADETPQVTANLRTLLSQFPTGGKQVHDANIVATMQAHGIRRLLTHNTADFARFASLILVLPL